MSKTYEIIRASTQADEFDGDVFQVVEWAMGHAIDNGENATIDAFYSIPARWTGERRTRAMIEWARLAVHGKFEIREVE